MALFCRWLILFAFLNYRHVNEVKGEVNCRVTTLVELNRSNRNSVEKMRRNAMKDKKHYSDKIEPCRKRCTAFREKSRLQ